MILRLFLIALFFGKIGAYGQLNVELVGNLDFEPTLSSLWGYTAEDGTEYAIVGHTSGVSIVSLADPANPVEIQSIAAVQSIWRELKTWGDFAYVVQDAGQEGMIIIDLSTLPDTAAYVRWRPDIPGLGLFNRAHTIWIDEFGLAYLNGGNLGGSTIVDVKPDPWNPQYLASMPFDYAHDVYVRDSLMYAAEIYKGEMGVYDLSNLADIRFLGSVTTPHAFTHNTWLSDDGKTVFTTDERANAFVGSYDVSDPANIKELDRFRPAETLGHGVIPHNVHVWDDFIIVAYYTDGCIVVDASRPDNLIEVGNFDTFLGTDGGFSGAWGAYPFFPSGNVIISDRGNGLYILAPNYVRGCFLEGSVTNAQTQLPVNNAQIEILLEAGDDSEVLLPEFADALGEFKMGKAVPGTYMIRVSHPDYFTGFVEGQFENGVVLELNIQLEPKPTHTVGGRVLNDLVFPTVVPFAHVALQGTDRIYQTQADDQGDYTFPVVVEGQYTLYAGNWGMYHISEVDIVEAFEEDIEISTGYYDDFLNDLGWTVTSTSTSGHWIRATPRSELLFNAYQCNPAYDLPDDIGSNAFVTGNAGGDAQPDDVDNGYTLLSSPVMDLTGYQVPTLSFSPWLCERFIEEHVYFILLSNGTDTVTIDTVSTSEIGGIWQTQEELILEDFMASTDQMQVHFLVHDRPEVDNVIKAALDRVLVYDAMPPSAVDDVTPTTNQLRIYPNPTEGRMMVELMEENTEVDMISLFDLYGKKIYETEVENHHISVDIPTINKAGIYIVQLSNKGVIIGIGKVALLR